MQTNFTDAQLKRPDTERSNEILRSCVHCGFCTATCPTYQVLGDELDSPRGRIYLIKDMLENERTPDAKTVKHIDRCLSCLSCMTTCPSDVHYMHLIDHARKYIHERYRRPFVDRVMRWGLSKILPYPTRFRLAMLGAKGLSPFSAILPKRLKAMLTLVPKRLIWRSAVDRPQSFPASSARIGRVALLTGCAQKALNTTIHEATIRILQRHGVEVVVAKGMGCCGALPHHMGFSKDAHHMSEANIRAWMEEVEGEGLDAIVINTSGCGTTVKDYGHLFRNSALSKEAEKISALAKDIAEVLAEIPLKFEPKAPLKIGYHAACSLQHGQGIKSPPKTLLKSAGFEVLEPKDAHLCCGSAGTYNLLQPEISSELKSRKIGTLEDVAPDLIASGNIGCMIQIGSGTQIPIVHTVELLDWATGGPKPEALQKRA